MLLLVLLYNERSIRLRAEVQLSNKNFYLETMIILAVWSFVYQLDYNGNYLDGL